MYVSLKVVGFLPSLLHSLKPIPSPEARHRHNACWSSKLKPRLRFSLWLVLLLELPRNFGLYNIFYFVPIGNFFQLPFWSLVLAWWLQTLSLINILNWLINYGLRYFNTQVLFTNLSKSLQLEQFVLERKKTKTEIHVSFSHELETLRSGEILEIWIINLDLFVRAGFRKIKNN